MKIIYTILILSKIADFATTVIQTPEAEENKLVKYIWQNFGDIGLFLVNALSVILMIVICVYTIKQLPKTKIILAISLLLFSAFVFLVALANMGNIIAYDLTSYIIGK